MNSLRVLSLLLAPVALIAQKPAAENVTHTYEMKTMDFARNQEIRELVGALANVSVSMSWLPALHTVVLRGHAPDVEMVEALLAKYDVPARQVEFTAYVVRASRSNEAFRVYLNNTVVKSAPAETPQPLPTALNSAIEEMKHTFGYVSFELMDTSITRTSSRAHAESGLNIGRAGYEINYEGVGVSNDGKVVTVPRFSFRIVSQAGRAAATATTEGRAAGGGRGTGVSAENISSLENEVVIHGDERLIVGKLRMPGTANGDVFVILTAKPL